MTQRAIRLHIFDPEELLLVLLVPVLVHDVAKKRHRPIVVISVAIELFQTTALAVVANTPGPGLAARMSVATANPNAE